MKVIKFFRNILSSTKNENSEKNFESPGDFVPLVWLIEKLRNKPNGCTMNELISEVRKDFDGLDKIKHRTINYKNKYKSII